jgi:acyl dehydratase
MSKVTIDGLQGLKSLVGKDLGSSEWREMRFEDIQKFADVTGDHQWIHVDREKAKAGPFGAPIAHGYFTLSLIAGLFFGMVETKGFKAVLNYGLGKVRFPTPLREGKKYRLSLKLADVKDVQGGADAYFAANIEIDGEAKPTCAAELIYRFIG